MSFEFSPQVLIGEINKQIEELETNIVAITQNKLIPRQEEFNILLKDPNRNFSEPLQQRFESVNSTIRRLLGNISSTQGQISDLTKQKDLLQKEADFRAVQFGNASITPGEAQALVIPNGEKLPLKELAIIGGAFLLLS